MEQYVFTGDTIPFQTGGNVCFCLVVGLGKTFNLSYHMINSDCKSQSYAHLMVFNKMAAKPRWPPKMP